MRYTFYPGCTLHSTGIEYGASTRAVLDELDVELQELPDWNCCGATSAHALDHELAVTLPGRNLFIAQQTGLPLLVPCAACYGRLKHAQMELEKDEGLRQQVSAAVGSPWEGGAAVESLLSVMATESRTQAVADRVRVRLKGLKVVPYYGCLLARPQSVTGAANPDHPTELDDLLSLLGAEVQEWSYKTDCCGGSLSLSRSSSVERLVDRLVARALEVGAECIATACPMCQANLEMRQQGKPKMPIFYFTELMGLAFGLQAAGGWWGKHLVDPRPLLRSVGLAQG